MRLSPVVRCLPLLFAFLSPAALLAQFTEPTQEELKMTADPKAPGAAAVYLYVEEIANDQMHYQSTYVRIKVLAEKGKELATVSLPYVSGNFKIADIKGRTIHADGTVIPLVGKPEDLLSAKIASGNGEHTQVNRKVFTLPSVEVGSILEYRYQLDYDDNMQSSPLWEIQRPYFVHKAHYVFTPFINFMPGVTAVNTTTRYMTDEHDRVINTLIWWPRLPQGVEVKKDTRSYLVDVTDVPPNPDEEWMPPIQSVLYKVLFYYKSASSAADFWATDSKLWSKDVDRFAEPSAALRVAVSGIVAPADSQLDKAKKLYKAVQALENTDYTRRKSAAELKQLNLKAAKHAEDVWKQKSGDSEEIAQLYLAMLRSAGLQAYAFKIVNRSSANFDASYMSLRQLDNTLVIVSVDGKEMTLDPGEKLAPFGTINWKHAAAGGIRQIEKNTAGATSPLLPYPENKTTRIGDVTLDAHGAFTGGNFRILFTGQEALYWRQKALWNDLDEVKKQFDQSLESIFPDGVEAHIDHFTGLDDPDVNLVAFINAKGSVGAATSKRLMLPAFFFETRGKRPFVAEEKRQQPVDMHYGDLIADQITYHFPASLTVEGAPQDAKLGWPMHTVFATKTIAAPGQITIVRQFASAFTFAKPDEYQELRGFYQKVAASDQQQVVLTTAAVAAPAPATATPTAQTTAAPKGN